MNGKEERELKEGLEAVFGPGQDLFEGATIYGYSRKQAIEDGTLVDVSETARECGIKFPVALTVEVFNRYVQVPEGVTCQDESGRLWDILWMFRNHANGTLRPVARYNEGPAEVIHFCLDVRNDNSKAKLVTLKAHCGPGDNLEPVITIMLPDQD